MIPTAQDYRPCLTNAVKSRRETVSNKIATATLNITLFTAAEREITQSLFEVGEGDTCIRTRVPFQENAID